MPRRIWLLFLGVAAIAAGLAVSTYTLPLAKKPSSITKENAQKTAPGNAKSVVTTILGVPRVETSKRYVGKDRAGDWPDYAYSCTWTGDECEVAVYFTAQDTVAFVELNTDELVFNYTFSQWLRSKLPW